MADVIVKAVEKCQDNFEGKIITDIIPGTWTTGLGEGKHAEPCPTDTHGMDEWVLNHLPFGTEEQRKKFLDDLITDQKREKRLDKWKKAKKLTLKRTSSEPKRESVKEMTKGS
jgi:hypothetical protein